ncbi:MAG: response regulator [Prevotella sp.]|nr:response regulator [Prevotella sp.]
MNLNTLILLAALVIMVVVFFVARSLYHRSMRIRNRLQMSTIFTNITHELLTPLTIISASVEHLRETEPKYAYDYDMMQLNIDRVVRLLQQMLETSKSQAGELKLLVSNGDVMTYIRETARCIEPLMAKRGLTFSIRCQPESMMGWIDTDKLDKIIFNLLSNAAKYTGEQGKVTLDAVTNRAYDHVTIRVSDNGPGIPKERMKRLFQRFYDGDYRSAQTIGTGIGLALTRDLVYLHGGTISVESTEGSGTTFIVELPIGKEAFSPTQIDEKNQIKINIPQTTILDFERHEQEAEQRSGNQKTTDEDAYKILIVEDNIELLVLMKQLLQSRYHILTATNGREALDVIHANDLDLIISDVMMPEMDGNELTAKVKLDPDYSHLPIILLTARTQEKDRNEALLIGADEYMMKPFKMGDLQLRIDNIIANRQRIQRDYQKQTVEETHKKTTASPTPDNEFLRRAIECVNAHLADGDYDRDAFAADMGASPSTLYNKLRSMTGLSVSSFIRDIRIKAACRMAHEVAGIRVSDLAYAVGFKDPKYFATIFKKEMGIQPKEYIERAQAE